MTFETVKATLDANNEHYKAYEYGIGNKAIELDNDITIYFFADGSFDEIINERYSEM